MSRTKGQDKHALKVRAELEGALGDIADYLECNQLVALRIQQAARRTGLGNLLVPALDELARMDADVASARKQVVAALARMQEQE